MVCGGTISCVGQMFYAINLAIRDSRGIENAVPVANQSLHLQFLGFENGGGLPLRSNSIYAGGSARGGIQISAGVRGNRPDIGGWCRRKSLKRGCELEAAGTANGHAGGRSLTQIVKFGLFPGASAFAESEVNRGERENRNEKRTLTQTNCQFHTSKPVLGGRIQIITEAGHGRRTG